MENNNPTNHKINSCKIKYNFAKDNLYNVQANDLRQITVNKNKQHKIIINKFYSIN